MSLEASDVEAEKPLPLSPLVLGGGVFSSAYTNEEYLSSKLPEQVIELALQNGINAIDTSPFYGVSEATIGSALRSPSISSKYPRESYHLITKCGRYGANSWSFDYSPERIVKSVKTSLERMQTEYLDAVYLHDVEFVADEVGKANHAGYPVEALADLEAYGLDEASAGRIVGKGDRAILDAYSALLKLKKEGLIRKAGIAGYPLPTLLRLARLIRHHLAPVDMLQTYSHYNLQTSAMETYLPHFRQAGVGIVLNASPLNMGLLSTQGAHFWHLAPDTLKAACKEAAEKLISEKQTTLQAVALGYGLKSSTFPSCHTVVGCNTPAHVEELMTAWNTLYAGGDVTDSGKEVATKTQHENEEFVWEFLRPTGYLQWSWQSPPPFVEKERT